MKKTLLFLSFFTFNFSLSTLNAQTINTVAGNGTAGYSGDGAAATAAELKSPYGVAVDASGNFYISDQANQRIRKVTAAGVITTIAGTGAQGYTGDGGQGTAAKIAFPAGICTDGSGNVYFADTFNNVIREINTNGIITTVVGNGIAGYSGDNGLATACELHSPQDVSVNAAGNNIYVADFSNTVVRKVDGSGKIGTFAGNGTAGFSGDGGAATTAELQNPIGVVLDRNTGFVYISDYNNNRIRVVNTGRVISTYAGNGSASFSGDGGPAVSAGVGSPGALAVDAAGNLYEPEFSNQRVRMINTSGVINTYAGNGVTGFSGDGGPATAAKFTNPSAVAVDGMNNVYIADFNNNRIREVFAPLSVNEINTQANGTVKVLPNPNNGSFTISIDYAKPVNSCMVEVYNIMGQVVYTNKLPIAIGMPFNTQFSVDLGSQRAGVYFLKLTGDNSVQTVKFIKE